MQIASLMAGFSLGEADLLRRAVSKKKREVLDEERAHFVKGSRSQGYSEEEANRVYDMIVRFADYGFPRAHAAAYGVLAFQTAWLKAHYPVPFMASMLASVTGNMRKTAEYADECRRMGIEVLPPDINESGVSFTPMEGKIRFGLASIKNVGTQAIEALLREREHGPFESLLDLCKRADLRVVNKRVLESLIQAGACDSLPGHRAQLLAALEETVEVAVKWRKEREELQIEMFGFEEVQNWDVELPDIRPFTTPQKLDFERELLGMYLSGHPLDSVSEQLEQLELDRLVDLNDAEDGTIAIVGVMIAGLKPFTNKKGNAMGFLEVEDRIMRVEAVVFPNVWKRVSAKLEKDGLVIMQATVQHGDEDYKLLVEDVVPIVGVHDHLAAQVRRMRQSSKYRAARMNAAGKQGNPPFAEPQRANPRASAGSAAGKGGTATGSATDAVSGKQRRLFIKITAEREQTDVLNRLKELLLNHQGDIDTALFYERENRMIALSDSHRVKPSEELKQALEKLLGPGTVAIR